MIRIRSITPLLAVLAVAACADAPTAVQPTPAALSVGAASVCAPTLAGPTAVSSNVLYTYKAVFNSADCPALSQVTWAVFGGTVHLDIGIKAYIYPDRVGECMHVHSTLSWANGTTTHLYKLARIDGYTGPCPGNGLD